MWLGFGFLFCFGLPPSFLVELLKDVKWISSVRESKGLLVILHSNTALDIPGFCGQLRAKDLFEVMDSRM